MHGYFTHPKIMNDAVRKFIMVKTVLVTGQNGCVPGRRAIAK